MTDLHDAPSDGRNARRERNVNRVLDVVLEMFAEDAMFPSMEQAAQRSGLSLRSLYRYFADPSELILAATARQHRAVVKASHLGSIGEGPLAERVDSFVAMRVALYEQFGAAFRATLANASHRPVVHQVLTARRAEMRQQFEQQFAPELSAIPRAERTAATSAGDALTQLDTVNLLRHEHGQSAAETTAALRAGLMGLLGD